jgi:hypothetical protein
VQECTVGTLPIKLLNDERDTMNKRELQVGEVVQLNPETVKNKMFSACFMVVTEPKTWGAQGYVQALGENEQAGGLAFYRANWNEMEFIGTAEWYKP